VHGRWQIVTVYAYILMGLIKILCKMAEFYIIITSMLFLEVRMEPIIWTPDIYYLSLIIFCYCLPNLATTKLISSPISYLTYYVVSALYSFPSCLYTIFNKYLNEFTLHLRFITKYFILSVSSILTHSL